MQINSQIDAIGARPTRVLTGRMVLGCLLAFFAIVAAVNAVMIRAAVSTFGGVETESSYKAGLAFAQDIAAAQTQQSRNWQVKAEVSSTRDGITLIEMSVRDAADQPISGLDAIVRFTHPTDRRFDRVVVMHENSAGHFGGGTRLAAGQRDVLIDLTRNGERVFRSKNRLVLR